MTVEQPQVFEQLMQQGRVPLDSWLAVPLDSDQVRDALARVRERLGRGALTDRRRFGLQLMEMICRHWEGRDTEAAYRTLSALAHDPHERALLELCRGQLLMAHRLQPARDHLDRGFQLAARLLEADAYFRVLGRHELLRHLPLSADPAPAASLDTLLRDARVIAQLKGRPGRPAGTGDGHGDTGS